jgi:hypothetical protein
MGGIWLQRIELLSVLSEHAGSKAGLALSPRQLRSHLPDHNAELAGRGDQLLRVRSDELAIMGAELLYAIGNTPSPRLVFWPPYDVLDQLQNDPKTAAMHTSMLEILKETLASSRPGPFDLKRFFEEMRDQHGPPGLEMAFRFIDTYYEQQHQSVFTESRRVEWADVAQLEHLFESEDLSTQYGQFLDQRFLDYLARNTEVLTTLRESNVLSDETASLLDSEVDKFKLEFQTGEGKPLASVGREEFTATKVEDVNQEKIVKGRR